MFFEDFLSLDVFTPLGWTHGVLSMIFGILGIFWIVIDREIILVEQNVYLKKNRKKIENVWSTKIEIGWSKKNRLKNRFFSAKHFSVFFR